MAKWDDLPAEIVWKIISMINRKKWIRMRKRLVRTEWICDGEEKVPVPIWGFGWKCWINEGRAP